MKPFISTSRRVSRLGFTLLEVLIVACIVAVLATLGFPLYRHLMERGREAACLSNMRVIHTGFTNYLTDNEMSWPQMPSSYLGDVPEAQYWGWWRTFMKPYGIEAKHWICLSDDDSSPYVGKENSEFLGSYIPTQFDSLPNTAFRWKQPWLIERGEYHGVHKGPNMLMPDGSIQKGLSLKVEQ